MDCVNFEEPQNFNIKNFFPAVTIQYCSYLYKQQKWSLAMLKYV